MGSGLAAVDVHSYDSAMRALATLQAKWEKAHVRAPEDFEALVRETRHLVVTVFGQRAFVVDAFERLVKKVVLGLRDSKAAQDGRDAKRRATMDLLGAAITELRGRPSWAKPYLASATHSKVFVVHGHARPLRDDVVAQLKAWKLEPVVLQDVASGGSRTIMEKLERHSDVGFAIVLLTPDDRMSYVEGAPSNTVQVSRARQNVVLELGYFIRRLGRDRVVVIEDPGGALESPSDVDGVMRVRLGSGKSWREQLKTELLTAGYEV